ncbi:MAG: RNase J family beta-CASP ribonuclease [Candidatus Pacearchaeota archaeon]|nr:MAG: RNase J family beta-CASP ribonuclease [Candidatus Pacearchaeota archaeon]
MIKLHAVGGYSEIGKNMTAIEIGDDAFIFDSGLYLPPIVEIEDKKTPYTEKKLRQIDAIPNDLVLKDIQNKVRAILVSHAHLDHVGAVPYTAHRYKAEVIATPFTVEVLKSLIRDREAKFTNKIRAVTPNSSFTVRGKKDHKIEFINITHSTLQTALIVLHTPKGAIVYANDFKFDNSPILGKKPNYKRLKELANEGILALIIDSVYADHERKTPSEKIARGLLEDVLLTTANQDACIIVTTFSSHIARLKSIVDCGKQLGRRILFLGRSLHRYVSAASRVKLVPFMKDIKLLSYRTQVERALKKVSKDRTKYMLVCTGHQGEPGSILDRMVRGVLPFKFLSRDHVIFSSSIIPNPINVANRKQLEKKLKARGVRIFTDVHVSGHCGREDIRDMIDMLQPRHVIPAHADLPKLSALAELATEMGYRVGKNVHILQNGQKLNLI